MIREKSIVPGTRVYFYLRRYDRRFSGICTKVEKLYGGFWCVVDKAISFDSGINLSDIAVRQPMVFGSQEELDRNLFFLT